MKIKIIYPYGEKQKKNEEHDDPYGLREQCEFTLIITAVENENDFI